jgi:hypothetical protein
MSTVTRQQVGGGTLDETLLIDRTQTNDVSEEVPASNMAFPIPLACKVGHWLAPVLLFLTDYLMVVFALHSAFWLRKLFVVTQDRFDTTFITTFVIIPLVYLGLIFNQKLYYKRLPLWKSIEQLFRISVLA